MKELKTTFEYYYPEFAFGGQCAYFAEQLVNFGPVGDTVASKTAYVKKYGILIGDLNNDFRIGDVIVFNITSAGHVAIINCIAGNNLQLTESNWLMDELVHHTRQTTTSNPKIIGIVRRPLKVKIIQSNQPVDIYTYVVSAGFSPEQFANFTPEVQAAIKWNDVGGINIIVDGKIVSRDPKFIYP